MGDLKILQRMFQALKGGRPLRKEELRLSFDQFVLLFKNAHVVGSLQYQIKKVIDNALPLSFATLPSDFQCAKVRRFFPQSDEEDKEFEKSCNPMTIALRSDTNKVIIEFPIDSERNWVTLNFSLINGQGKIFFLRKTYEIFKEKKVRLMRTEKL